MEVSRFESWNEDEEQRHTPCINAIVFFVLCVSKHWPSIYMKIARATEKGRAEVREVNKAVMVRTPNDLVCVYLNLFVDSSRPHEV